MNETLNENADEQAPNPNGCRWCGADREEHLQRWAPTVKWHAWVEPTAAQRKERLLARRARRHRSSDGLLAG
ncbi:MAG: hypothetical protein ABWY11_20770 [Umezawaea sp.]